MRSFLALFSLLLLMACTNQPAPQSPAGHKQVEISIDTLNLNYALVKEVELNARLLKVGLLPDDSITAKIAAHFNQEVLDLAGNSDFAYKNRAQLADSLKAEFSRLFVENADFMPSWSLVQNLSVVLNDSGRLGLNLQQESYLGGAHPNSYSLFLYYNLSSGAVLALADVIPNGDLKGLQSLAEEALRKEYRIASGESLSKAGFWLEDERLPLPKNFRLQGDTLHLIYNPYEIAPYAMGSTVISLSPADLQKLANTAEPNA